MDGLICDFRPQILYANMIELDNNFDEKKNKQFNQFNRYFFFSYEMTNLANTYVQTANELPRMKKNFLAVKY